MNDMAQNMCDVLVIGGGPGGTTVASLLAEQGKNVVLVEKAKHPRFHIGESLLPMNLGIFERLGILDEVHKIGVVKPGAEFVDPEGKSQIFYFSRAIDHKYPSAFHVKRDDFDHLLLQNCQQKGVSVHENITVKHVNFSDEKSALVNAQDEQGQEIQWQAKFVVDASGRDTFLAKQFGVKQKNKRHQSAAMFGHFKNVPQKQGKDFGNITLYWFEYGWFWFIPLPGDVMSVGAVCWPDYLKTRRGSKEEFFQQTLELHKDIKERMKNAELISDIQVTGNFSYRSDKLYGKNYIMIGDAFSFIDPVFSSGVYLAMDAGVKAADVVSAHLENSPHAEKLAKRYERHVRRGLKKFSWFIYRCTSPTIRKLLLAPRNYFRVEEGVASILAGDIFTNKKADRAVFFFKVIYYITSLKNISGNWVAHCRRRLNAKAKFPETQT